MPPIAVWLLSAVMMTTLLAGCSKAPAPPAPMEPPPSVEPPPPVEPPPLAALTAPDLTRASRLVVKRAPAPASAGPPLHLSQVAFVTPAHGFGVGWQGAIYRTEDGGRNWTQVAQHEGVRLNRLEFAGEQVGWAFGYQGCGKPSEACGPPVVIRTADGGQTWQATEAQGLPTADPGSAWRWQMRLVVLTADVAFAANAGSPLLRTTDGGRTWNALELPKGIQPAGGIHFFSSERGYVSGSRSKQEHVVLATADGGRSWQTIHEGKVPIRAIHFLDEQRGFLGGGFEHWRVGPVSRILLATEDGGATWEERSTESQWMMAPPITLLHFSSPDRGLAEQEHGPVVRTTDGGRTWTPLVEGRWLAWPAMAGEHLWVRWGEIGHAFLFHSADGGQTWGTLAQRGALLAMRVQFASPEKGWMATEAGILKTDDGGETWSQTGLLSPTLYPGIPTWLEDQVLLRYGEGRGSLTGTLERSEDGGQTWNPVLAEVSHPRISFVSLETGYLVSRSMKNGPGEPYPDILKKSVDGGRTWQTQPTQLPVGAMISFADEQHGAAAGGYIDQRRLMLTADGGKSWRSLPLPDLWVRSIHYGKEGHLWLAVAEEKGARRGLLLHSPDRGASWEVFEVEGAGEFVVQVHFSSPADGWLIARLGGTEGETVLARTRDGGQSWRQVWP